MIGRTLSFYKITAKLGKGGMGEVWRATDTRLDRDVALKVLPPEMATDPERLERFKREAKAIAALNHPNIVTIHSVEEAEGLHLLTMELVEGQSLDQMLPASGFDLERLFPLAIQIADALTSAHGKGIIHRDLKPANVMVTGDGRAKVLDFGLAKLAEPEEEAEETQLMTQAGMVLGTVAYMSPEQVQAKPVDPRTDIFSLGILLYEMATGERPFRGDNAASVISELLKDEPPVVTEVNSALPSHLGRIIQRCLEKVPADRYQTMRDVALELSNLRREIDTPTATGVAVLPPHPVRRGLERRFWVWGLSAVALLALGSLGLWNLADQRVVAPPKPGGPGSTAITRISGPRAQVLYEQAQQYRSDAASVARWELAEKTMRQAVEIDPDNGWLRTELADLLVARQQSYPDVERKQEASRLAEEALEADPDLAAAWVVKGRLARLEGDHRAALEAATKAKSLDSADHRAAYLLGFTLIRQGAKEDGLAEVRKATELDPDPINVHYQLGSALQHVGQLDEAILEYRRATEYAPGHASALNSLAVCYFWMGRYREAIPVFRRLLGIRPEDKRAAVNLGTVYYYVDRLEEAIETYKLADRLHPGDPLIQTNLGDAYTKVGKPEEARDWYLRALASADQGLAQGGRRKNLLEQKYLGLAKVGRFDEATAGAEQLAKDYSASYWSLYTAAQIYALAGQRSSVLEYTERAVRAGCPREEFGRSAEFDAFQDDPAFQELLAADLDNP